MLFQTASRWQQTSRQARTSSSSCLTSRVHSGISRCTRRSGGASPGTVRMRTGCSTGQRKAPATAP
eukprot:805591-Alexandrium_andersonii.AAC.1